ncbi:MAG: hypothetical protein H0Z34_06705 [Brevibacillus sp.]|nr:hypothetical protein [Brevibacillus sp.]
MASNQPSGAYHSAKQQNGKDQGEQGEIQQFVQHAKEDLKEGALFQSDEQAKK